MPINKEVSRMDRFVSRLLETGGSKREFETAFGCDDDNENGGLCGRDVSDVVLFDINGDDGENPGGEVGVPIMICVHHRLKFKERFEWLYTDPYVSNVRILSKDEYVRGGEEALLARVIGWLIGRKG